MKGETFAGEPLDPYALKDEVRRLRAENEKLRAVLKEVSVCLDGNRTGEDLDEAAGVITQINNMCAGLDERITELEAEVLVIRRKTIAECADVARKTYAKDAFHFELGTAAASNILDMDIAARAALGEKE